MGYSDDGFGSGFGMGVDPHSAWEGPSTTRGVMREPSRIRRSHDDERALHARRYPVGPGAPYANNPGFHQGYPQYVDHQNEHPVYRDPRGYEHGLAHGTDMGFGESFDRGPHYGKGPKGYRRSDERIREEACERIARQGVIDATDVELTVLNGVIKLTGTVATRAEKRGLEELLDRVHGVADFENELRLRREVPVAAQTKPREKNGFVAPPSSRSPSHS